MQSRRKMKRIQDYEIGERIYDEDHCPGRMVASELHPENSSIGYILVVNTKKQYTIYRGLTDAKGALCLARNIPEGVAMHFAEAIMGKDVSGRSSMRKAKKFPVVKSSEPEKLEKPEEEKVGLAPIPYLDFF